MKQRQVIACWYTPEEKMPPEYVAVVISVSGRRNNIVYDHALMIGMYSKDGLGWEIEGWFTGDEDADITVHAWCDLDPYA